MPASHDQEHEQLRNDVSQLLQFMDEFDANSETKLGPVIDALKSMKEEADKLRADVKALREELSSKVTQVELNSAKVTAERAEAKANAAATRAELANYLPKAGGTISGKLVVTDIFASTLKVGNIYGHGTQQIHMPSGSAIYLNWHHGRGDVVLRGTYQKE